MYVNVKSNILELSLSHCMLTIQFTVVGQVGASLEGVEPDLVNKDIDYVHVFVIIHDLNIEGACVVVEV